MLKQAGIYNNISKELIPEMPKKGTVVYYECIQARPNPQRDALNPKGTAMLPSILGIPCTSTFFDSVKDEWIDIGLVDTVSADGHIEFQRRSLRPDKDAGMGVTIVIGSSKKNDDFYQYMELASFVETEGKILPNGKVPLFRKVDGEKDALKRKKARDLKYEAYNHAVALNAEEGALSRAAILIGRYDSTISEESLREAVEGFAEEHPQTYFDIVVNDKHGDAKAAMRMAIHLGIVEVANNELKWAGAGGSAIMTITSDRDADIQFANYIIGDPKGGQIYGIIKDQISKKVSAKKAKK